jgi:hypothetical protein
MPAVAFDDEGALDPEEVELLAELLLDVLLRLVERKLGVLASQEGFVVIREVLRDLGIGADAGSGQIGLLIHDC